MDVSRYARFLRPGHAVTRDRHRTAQEKRDAVRPRSALRSFSIAVICTLPAPLGGFSLARAAGLFRSSQRLHERGLVEHASARDRHGPALRRRRLYPARRVVMVAVETIESRPRPAALAVSPDAGALRVRPTHAGIVTPPAMTKIRRFPRGIPNTMRGNRSRKAKSGPNKNPIARLAWGTGGPEFESRRPDMKKWLEKLMFWRKPK